jgi:tungstate transport system permease protein
MNDFTQSVASALFLIGSLDPELMGIVLLSLRVSLSASLLALAIGAPIGVLLAIGRFRRSPSVLRERSANR